ncbi:MAG: type II toxin-antitoxin system HicB family antitoxin [Holophagales bacterium]|nr:type II toxin-antitoxin system HicB family antitoxin [Holophagales bacterium]MYG31797.1 type II toxin-antitoxin system HicB family antitoxin [Holophagales bacterium]MYI79639.1 type II toxin-antitoxin system HicB family antitoxin [Holophagales bacterium]
MKYTIVIERAPNNYAAYAPDLPGCVATAKSRSQVIQLMREGIAFHLQGLRDEGQPVPPPQATATEVDVALAVGP